jgi:hypothetical protein
VKRIKAAKVLLDSIFDSALDSDKIINIEHFAGIKDDSSEAFYTTGQFLSQGVDPYALLQ